MWLILGTLAALGTTARDIIFSTERIRTRFTPLECALGISACALPVHLTALAITGIPEIKQGFWWYVTGHACLLAGAYYQMMRGLSLGKLSEAQPATGLTPVLVLLLAPMVTSHRITVLGWVGVLMASLGLYTSQLPRRHQESVGVWLTRPFAEMRANHGVWANILASLWFAGSSVLDPLAVEASGPACYKSVGEAMISALLLGALLIRNLRGRAPISSVSWHVLAPTRRPWHVFVIGGMVSGALALTYMYALTLTRVQLLVTVKRSSILTSSAWGYIRRHEPVQFRVIGLALVFLGIALISLYGRG